jgi:hypothetical protein
VTVEGHGAGRPSKAIAIPLADQRALGEFIASLLGQRRTIECDFRDRRFEIDFEWLLNLNDVIDQRIQSQHAATLVSFSARFYFGNGKIVTLEDIKSFRTYNDISAELSVGVDLRWSFLIQFPLADTPEKQELRFAAFTDKRILGGIKVRDRQRKASYISLHEDDERLYYTVLFTNVTWGEDLNATISSFILGHSEALPRWKKYTRSMPVSLTVPLIFLLGITSSFFVLLRSLVNSIDAGHALLTERYGDLSKIPDTLDTVDKKLSFLVSEAVIRFQPDSLISFSPAIKTVVFCVTVSCVLTLASITERSSITVNEFSAKTKKTRHAKYETIKYALLVAALIGVLSGIFANILYEYIHPIVASILALIFW